MNGIVAYESLATDYWYAPPLREIVDTYYFQKHDRLPQYLMEYALRARMAELPNIESRFGWAAETVEQDEGGVRVTIAGPGGRDGDYRGRLRRGLRRRASMVRQQSASSVPAPTD